MRRVRAVKPLSSLEIRSRYSGSRYLSLKIETRADILSWLCLVHRVHWAESISWQLFQPVLAYRLRAQIFGAWGWLSREAG
jgi:hypothetical protein